MSYIRRLWLIIVRRGRHSLYLFLLVFLFALLGVVSCFFRNIISSYENAVICDLGYSLMFYRIDGDAIPQEVLDEISRINGVTGYNQEYDMLVTPINFYNVIDYNASDVFTVPDSDMIRLYANTDASLNPIFSNNMELIAGELPSGNNGGAIIDEVLARDNGLFLGDTLLIKNQQSNNQIAIAIIGIYKASTLPKESWKLSNAGVWQTAKARIVMCFAIFHHSSVY